MDDRKIPTVALIGRTNVGKSTLFNRMLEQPKALVSDIPGTTRDRNEGECIWRGKTINLVDTGGLDVDKKDAIERNTILQAEHAMKKADLILFVLDAKVGPLPQEHSLALTLNKSKVPVIVVANKAESAAERADVKGSHWFLHGLKAPIAVSAKRGSSVGDLLDEIFEQLERVGTPPIEIQKIEATRVAVIGKPNVGKSTLLNSMIGEERFITSPIAHTTREPNDTLVQKGDKNYIFVDTAGMRKSGKVKKSGGLEAAAVKRNEYAIKISDVTLLIVDATEPIGAQEKILAGFLKESGTGVIVIVNKWDLVKDKTTTTMNRYREYVAASLPFLEWAPVLFISALTKQRVQTIYDMIDTVQTNRNRWLTEKEMDEFLKRTIAEHRPTAGKGIFPPKILGMKQVAIAPPEFDLILKAKRTDILSQSYIRFIINRLHDTFHLNGTSVRMNIRIARSTAV
ncbi:ribosome biogenesis GTPase Der [Candidatus Uhrbacteria bacterium]|nr:ribosome biogenesis GTPase Der [Candidatus Uhrbacteria bacterium]